jgi:hypothetical protein
MLFVLVTGCTARPIGPARVPTLPKTTTIVTPTPIPDPCHPTDQVPEVLNVWGNFTPRRMAAPGGCQWVVDTQRLTINVPNLEADSAEAAVKLVTLMGATPTLTVEPQRGYQGRWSVGLDLPAGPVGQKITISVAQPSGQPVTATLIRKQSPTVSVTMQGADGTWAPFTPGVSLGAGPKRLRFEATGGVAPKLVFVTTGWQGIKPDQVSAQGNQTEVLFTNPPPLVQVLIGSEPDVDGLIALQTSVHFYIGEPPKLVAVSPASGKEDPIGPAPADLGSQVALRGDGRYLALISLIPEAAEGNQVWLVDLKTGTLTRTPFQYGPEGSPGFDIRGRLISPLQYGHVGILDPATGKSEVQLSAATQWGKLSPDGRFMAGRVGAEPGRGTGAWIGPPSASKLVVRDLMHDTEKVFPWHEGYAAYGGVDWLPDGTLLQMSVRSNGAPGMATEEERKLLVYTVNVATGDRAPYTQLWPKPYTPDPNEYKTGQASDRFLTWLPDGRALLLRWPNLENQRSWIGP